VNFSIESLVRALTVSKYCRQVILGSVELRRILFLDPSPATEFLEWDDTQTLSVPKITSSPSQNSRMIVKAHPSLRLQRDMCITLYLHCYGSRSSSSNYSLSLITMQTIPPSTLLFQPSPAKVKISYSGHSFTLQQKGGLTFGAMAEGWRELRRRSQKEIGKLVKLPCTALNRMRYAEKMEALNDPPGEYDSDPWQCIVLEAEGVICDDSEDVRMARPLEGMAPAGW